MWQIIERRERDPSERMVEVPVPQTVRIAVYDRGLMPVRVVCVTAAFAMRMMVLFVPMNADMVVAAVYRIAVIMPMDVRAISAPVPMIDDAHDPATTVRDRPSADRAPIAA